MSAHGRKRVKELSSRPIERLSEPLTRFVEIEASSGIVLLAITLLALILAQTALADPITALWQLQFTFGLGALHGHISLEHLVNDGLMALFFFVIGLEIKREIVVGELRQIRKALLPIFAAAGGMIVPALLYFALQSHTEAARGWGIPMATDIAFVVGVLAIFSRYVPHGLRVLLLTLAIVDDLGAVLVIAFAYTETISWYALGSGFIFTALIAWLIRLGSMNMFVFSILSFVVWVCFYSSGVHATIAGVLLGLIVPVRAALPGSAVKAYGEREGEILCASEANGELNRVGVVWGFMSVLRASLPPAEALQRFFHSWVSFLIMPLFAFVNAGVKIELHALMSPLACAVIVGLVVGKLTGVVGASLIAVKLGIASLPQSVTFLKLVAGGALAGIGFTMALFLTTLSLPYALTAEAKLGVIFGSLISAIIGIAILVGSGEVDAAEAGKKGIDGHN